MTDAPAAADPRCGFIAILGAPNVGKSTLLNRLVGAKVSIVSPKMQTTRNRVLGIAMAGPAQLVFIDTPGIFAPRRRLDRAMVQAAWRGAADADLALLLVDASRRGIGADTRAIIGGLRDTRRQAILVINKIDLVRHDALLGLAARLHGEGIFTDVFMVSAATGDGVGDLRHAMAARVPHGPWHYPPDQLADMPMRLLAAEITREQLFRQLHQELPYALTVESERWEDFDNGSVRIDQILFVQRAGQKAIVLGKGGQQIRAARTAAQRELENILGRKVHLFIHVKVRENWPEDRERFRELGLEFDV